MGFFALAAAAPTVVSGVSKFTSAVGSIFGDSHPDVAGPCPQQPAREQVELMVRNAPASELDQLKRLWRAAANNSPMPYVENKLKSLDRLIRDSMGGADCYHPSNEGRAYQDHFLQLVAAYGGAGTAVVPSSNGAAAAAVMTDQYGTNYRMNPYTKAWEIIRELPERVARGALEGAVEAAAGTASDAARPIEAERARTAIAKALPMILAGFAVAMLLRR